MSDEFVYETSLEDEQDPTYFQNKKWLYVGDTNNGTYGGQVLFDTTSLSNSGMYMDYSQAVLTIPTIVTLSSTGTADFNWSAVASEYMAGLKNGSHQLIHKMSVAYNNTDIIAPVDFTNAYVSYKLMNTMCTNDLETIAPSMLFAPDDSRSWGYMPNGQTAFGHGSVNNSNFAQQTAPTFGWQQNQLLKGNSGLIKRQELMAQSLAGTNYGQVGKYLADETAVATSLNNYVEKKANYCAMYIIAQVRLKDIHDYFAKVPLLKGSVYRFTFFTNECYFEVNKSGSNDVGKSDGTLASATECSLSFNPSSLLMFNAGTNPLMITSCNGITKYPQLLTTSNADAVVVPAISAYGAGTQAVSCKALSTIVAEPTKGIFGTTGVSGAGDRLIQCSVSIVKVTNTVQAGLGTKAFGITCRLYVPGYVMNTAYDLAYISKGHKAVTYTDIQYYPVLQLGKGSAFTRAVSSGVKNLKRVILIPFIGQNVNGECVTALGNQTTKPGFSTMRSPFSSEPATTSPLLGSCFNALNVRLGGQQLLTSDIQYGYEAFEQQLMGIDGISGNLKTGRSSGLMNRTRWQNNYQYYVFDCSRHTADVDNLARTVEVFGNVKALVDLDLFVYLEYEKTIVYDIITGAIVSQN
jgi:hypothetical protein